jgi:dihydroorotate dehydrogenase (NAD+) catalytic subunit
VGFGEEYTRIDGFSNRDVGAIVLKGTTGQPRLGNRPHRVYETPAGMLNAIGLQNPGANTWCARSCRRSTSARRASSPTFGIDHRGDTRGHARVRRSPIDAIEINISCPTSRKAASPSAIPEHVGAASVEACRKATSKPMITKLSPNQTDIQENARRCIEAGSNGLAVINTIMGMAIDVKSRRPVIGNVQGGLSGPAIKPIALLKVHQVYEVARKHK